MKCMVYDIEYETDDKVKDADISLTWQLPWITEHAGTNSR